MLLPVATHEAIYIVPILILLTCAYFNYSVRKKIAEKHTTVWHVFSLVVEARSGVVPTAECTHTPDFRI